MKIVKRIIRNYFFQVMFIGLALLYFNTGKFESSVFAANGGTNYYVDSSLTTNGDGQEAHPFNNLVSINAITLQAGDKVLFKRGTVYSGTFIPKGSGTNSSPILIGAYGGGTSRPIINADGQTDAVLLKNVQYIQLRDLELTASGDNKTVRRGVHVLGQDAGDLYGIVLQNLEIHDVRGYMPSTTGGNIAVGKYGNASGGIVIEVLGSAIKTAFHDIKVLDNTVHSVDRQGIYTWSNWCQRPELVGFWFNLCTAKWNPFTNVLISGNHLSDIGGDGIVAKTSTDVIVEHNTLEGFNVRSNSPNAGMWTANTNHVLFQYNSASGGKTTSDGMAYDVDHSSNNITFQYNLSYDNEGGFFLLCPYAGSAGQTQNFTIRYNISINDHARLFQSCGGKLINGQIYNNTMYVGPNIATSIFDGGSTIDTVTFANNIVYSPSGGRVNWSTSNTNLKVDHNVLYGVPIPSWATNTITSNPGLTGPSLIDAGGYKLLTGSSALGAGIRIADNGGRDYFGTALQNSTPNIGAYEGAGEAQSPVTGVTLSPATLTLAPNDDPFQLIASVAPLNTSNTSLSWLSSDLNIATVDVNGKVTPKSEGSVTITVTTLDGNFQASSQVTVIPSSPIAFYKFEEKSGTIIADSSGRGYTGGLVGGTLQNTVGVSGQGLAIPGQGVYASLPNFLDPGRVDFTAIGWVYLDEAKGGNQYILQQEGSQGRSWLYRRTDNGKLGSFLGGSELLTTNTIPLRQWTQVAVVKKGNVISLYLNGLLNATSSRNVETSIGNFRLGAHKNPDTNNQNWKGSLDEFRFYDKSLNDIQISQLYNQNIPNVASSLDELTEPVETEILISQ
ncbi:LamG-like jellyroll fold domain-containing protein [Paenibacillus pini]|nr:LamG-like jellyroll fold domain-containing protein [Paenibacillus pini]